MKLSIAVGGASYDPNNAVYSPFDSLCAEDEDERITLPGLENPLYSQLEQAFADDEDERITLPAPEEDGIVFF